MTTPAEEFAWACGLFEGEGTLGLYSNGRAQRHIATMAVVMSDLDVLERFQAALDGAGTIDGPYTQKSARKPLYRWRWRGGTPKMADLIHRMWPFLGPRRRAQAQPILDRASTLKAR